MAKTCDVCSTPFEVDRAHARQQRCSKICWNRARADQAKTYYSEETKNSSRDKMRLRRANGLVKVNKQYHSDYYLENLDRARDVALQNKYAISLAEYETQLVDQQGLCALCDQPCSTGYRLAVDHDHATGIVRGLLCGNCNNGLGRFKDNPEVLRLAAAYLEDGGVWHGR